MSPARFLAAAVAIYGTAICAGVVLYLVFRDSLEDLWEKLRLRLAHRQMARSRGAPRLQFGARAPQIWESAALGVGAGWGVGHGSSYGCCARAPQPSQRSGRRFPAASRGPHSRWSLSLPRPPSERHMTSDRAAKPGRGHPPNCRQFPGTWASRSARRAVPRLTPRQRMPLRACRTAPRAGFRDRHHRGSERMYGRRRSSRTCNRCPSTQRRRLARRSAPQPRRVAVPRRSRLPRPGRLPVR